MWTTHTVVEGQTTPISSSPSHSSLPRAAQWLNRLYPFPRCLSAAITYTGVFANLSLYRPRFALFVIQLDSVVKCTPTNSKHTSCISTGNSLFTRRYIHSQYLRRTNLTRSWKIANGTRNLIHESCIRPQISSRTAPSTASKMSIQR